jgi:hypothetical protein
MKKIRFLELRMVLICAAVLVVGIAFRAASDRGPAPAFGGNFAPGMAQPSGAKYQIAGCDANSAWVIDTGTGDVYLIYANGKWKEVGSIQDEKKRIKR